MMTIDYSVSGGLCRLRMDSGPVNAIGFAMLEEICEGVRRANEDEGVRGIVITGGARQFSAGADVGIFERIKSGDEAREVSRVFQEAFGVVEASEKPVAALMAGKVSGGALELAMACHYRVCEGGSRFGMPEVRLGINPGAGGTQRLVRLVGVEKAVEMLLGGKSIGAGEAREAGLVDEVCAAEEWEECAMRLMEGAMKRTSGRVDKISDKGVNEAGYALGEKMAGTQRAEIIAPRRIVEAVRAGIEESFEAGLRKEREGFAACMETAATRNMIYLFFAGRKTGRVAEIAGATPREVRRAAVVGMGSMGTGIAHALIMAGVEAVVVDEDEGALERGAAKIRRSVEKQAAAGRVSRGEGEEMLGRLRMTREWGEIAGADLVIEAVYEDAGLKRKVIGEIARVCSGDCIIATNTSTLSLDVLAEGMKGAERFVGMHFFNPAQRMPLVEVIRREGVDKGVLAGAAAFAKRMGKVPVVVRNREGFVVNRIFIGYLKEAFYLLGDGADARAVDAAAVEFGFPMGPLALMDMTGLDVLSFTDEVMREAFAHYGEAAGVLEALVARGRLGQKRGKGVYRYEEGDYTAVDDPECERIIAEARGEGDKKACGVDKEMIVERLLMRMVSEGLRVAEEGIAERESDIDVAMVMGTGFPGFRGGVLRYARDMGMRTVVERLDALAGEYGERFGSSEFLQRLKGAQ